MDPTPQPETDTLPITKLSPANCFDMETFTPTNSLNTRWMFSPGYRHLVVPNDTGTWSILTPNLEEHECPIPYMSEAYYLADGRLILQPDPEEFPDEYQPAFQVTDVTCSTKPVDYNGPITTVHRPVDLRTQVKSPNATTTSLPISSEGWPTHPVSVTLGKMKQQQGPRALPAVAPDGTALNFDPIWQAPTRIIDTVGDCTMVTGRHWICTSRSPEDALATTLQHVYLDKRYQVRDTELITELPSPIWLIISQPNQSTLALADANDDVYLLNFDSYNPTLEHIGQPPFPYQSTPIGSWILYPSSP